MIIEQMVRKLYFDSIVVNHMEQSNSMMHNNEEAKIYFFSTKSVRKLIVKLGD